MSEWMRYTKDFLELRSNPFLNLFFQPAQLQRTSWGLENRNTRIDKCSSSSSSRRFEFLSPACQSHIDIIILMSMQWICFFFSGCSGQHLKHKSECTKLGRQRGRKKNLNWSKINPFFLPSKIILCCFAHLILLFFCLLSNFLYCS